jgi:hypothetical protein
MPYDEQLSVITPVSRPELLAWVALSLPPHAEWILVTDGALSIPGGLPPHILIHGPRTQQWGDVQRQLGLEAATRPFVYFLDDDNLMLPSLADLLIPYLETHALAGALFGILVHLSRNETHIWPAPPRVRLGCVDTAMFLGRREAILQLHFHEPVASRGWPNLQGLRYADFIFLKAFEDTFGLARLPALYGFHDAIALLQQLEPQFFRDLQTELKSQTVLADLLNDYLIRADVPPWW